MFDLEVKSRAKINLTLYVQDKRSDNYHNLDMIMQEVDLSDKVFLKKINKGIKIESNLSFIPTDESNIAYKVAKRVIDNMSIEGGIHIYIEKIIPVAAGLAGGSSNGAAVIKGMNELYNLGLSNDKMADMIVDLGADIPFCIHGGCYRATGIGDVLEKIHGLNTGYIVICKPNIGISTKEAYESLVLNEKSEDRNSINMIKALQTDNIYNICNNLHNDFEKPTIEKYNDVSDIKKCFKEYGAIGSMMSGSGPSVFGLFNSQKKANSAAKQLSKKYVQTFVTFANN